VTAPFSAFTVTGKPADAGGEAADGDRDEAGDAELDEAEAKVLLADEPQPARAAAQPAAVHKMAAVNR
jgi:hypothetical protein